MLKLYRKYWVSQTYQGNIISACGWLDYKGRIFHPSEIIDLIIEEYIKLGKEISKDAVFFNGNFTIIIGNPKETTLLVDRMRTYPIVYFINQDQLIVTDDIITYYNEFKPSFQIDEISCEQFLSSNYIIGPYTIYKDVFSVQSGEIVTINNTDKNINRTQYYQWAPNMENDNFERDLNKEATLQDEIFLRVFKRMVESSPNVHNWVIPLSGGYDSRTIVNYLYKLGIKNVICYSYGMIKNIQSEISREVAEALGFKWYFLDYKEWVPKMQQENIIDDYIRLGFNGSSVAHLQDFPAVYALVKQKILQEGDIFVPGHALEVIAGNHLKYSMLQISNSKDALAVLRHHYSGFGYHTEKRVNILKRFDDTISEYHLLPTQLAECFDWQERQTKFIANSVKVYEYFDLEWRIPEWDMDLMNYWSKIGFNYRIDRNMFKEIFKTKLAVQPIKNLPFANDLVTKAAPSFKDAIINLIPFKVKKILKKKGWYKSFYYADEGLHLIYSDQDESISEYLQSYKPPICVTKYLKAYYKYQKISGFDINGITTLKNIRSSIS